MERLREGQIGFESPKCASAWDLHLVEKLRLLAKPIREREENMDGTRLLCFHPHPRGGSEPPLFPFGLLCYVSLCLVDFEVRPRTKPWEMLGTMFPKHDREIRGRSND